jgi:hypothetical protein
MRTLLGGLLAVSLLALGANLGRTDDADTVKAVLDKAIKAIGGEEKLTKLQALTLKGKGTFHEEGRQMPFTGVWQTQGIDKSRSSSTVDVKGIKNTEVRILNGNKGWSKSNDDKAEDFSDADLTEEKESAYLNYVTTLAPLKGKNFTLTSLGESKVDDRPVIGIKVSSKGHRDIKLFFDKETGLLAKSERPVKEVEKKKMYTEEILFSDYKEADGIKVAMKYILKWDGKVQIETEMTEAKAEEKLDDKTFAKP